MCTTTARANEPERSRRTAGLVVVAALLVTACAPSGNGPEDSGTDDAGSSPRMPTGSVCAPGSTSTYDSFGRAFFDGYCASCHAATVVGGARLGAPSSATYDDVASIRASAAEIDRRAAAGPDAVNTDMPRGEPRPVEGERRQLGEWLACGAP
jgi:uncharacterized membrane protein